MQKRKYILIMLFAGLLVVSLAITYLYVKRQERLAQRYHLLCEVLEPGMSEDEVLGVLKQAGDFTMSRGEWSGGLIELGINFTDIKGRELYGMFDLFFIDCKYMRAYLRNGSDNLDIICDFYQPTQSATETPKP
jgi:hypothetical protein